MTHPTYTSQTLNASSIPHLKTIYAQIGCTAEVSDKRKKANWVTAILEHQAGRISKAQETTIYKEESAEVQVEPTEVEFALEVGEAQLFQIGDENNSYSVYLHGEWLGDIHRTAEPRFTFSKESWCIDGVNGFVSSTKVGVVEELVREFANSDEVQAIPPVKGIEDCNQIEPTTPKVQLFEPELPVQVHGCTVTFVQTLPSGQHAHRCEKGGEFVGYLFQVPDDDMNTSYHWEANGQQFLTLEAAAKAVTIPFAGESRIETSYDDLKLLPTMTEHCESQEKRLIKVQKCQKASCAIAA